MDAYIDVPGMSYHSLSNLLVIETGVRICFNYQKPRAQIRRVMRFLQRKGQVIGSKILVTTYVLWIILIILVTVFITVLNTSIWTISSGGFEAVSCLLKFWLYLVCSNLWLSSVVALISFGGIRCFRQLLHSIIIRSFLTTTKS